MMRKAVVAVVNYDGKILLGKKRKTFKFLSLSDNMKKTEKDWLAILVFFIGASFSLNVHEPAIHFQILGIAFIIAGTYGIVSISKKKKFIF